MAEPKWTAITDELLAANYAVRTCQELAEELTAATGRRYTAAEVRTRVVELGLSKGGTLESRRPRRLAPDDCVGDWTLE
jgi:hypothetical protein